MARPGKQKEVWEIKPVRIPVPERPIFEPDRPKEQPARPEKYEPAYEPQKG